MAETPIIAAKNPAKVDLTKGETYTWCRCGRSQTQPFCDGSHRGTGITPKSFKAEEDGTAYLCRCKATGNAPFCDGTHKKFAAADVGKEGPGLQVSPSVEKTSLPVAEPTPEEPTVALIHLLARDGLSKVGHHGQMTSMGVILSPITTIEKVLRTLVSHLSSS